MAIELKQSLGHCIEVDLFTSLISSKLLIGSGYNEKQADAGRPTGSNDVDSRALRRVLSVTRFRNPLPTYCSVVCWRGLCGPLAFGGGTERISCSRKRSGSPIGFNPGGVDLETCMTSGRYCPSLLVSLATPE
jgi:hypothetical protein